MGLSQQQLAERKLGVGASDAPAIVGVSPWASPYSIYLAKIGEQAGERSPDAVEAMRWGQLLEPVVLAEYERRSGLTLFDPLVTYRHPRHDWMLANLDGVAQDGSGNQRIVEVKTTASPHEWGEPGTSQVPVWVMAQVQHQMEVTDIDICDVAVLFAGSRFAVYRVERDRKLGELLVQVEEQFWQAVVNRKPPHANTVQDAQQRWREVTPQKRVVAPKHVAEACLEASKLQKQLRAINSDLDRIKASIINYMEDAEELVAPTGTVLATNKLRAAYTRPATEVPAGRVLRIKGTPDKED